jgi:hypothetical protein
MRNLATVPSTLFCVLKSRTHDSSENGEPYGIMSETDTHTHTHTYINDIKTNLRKWIWRNIKWIKLASGRAEWFSSRIWWAYGTIDNCAVRSLHSDVRRTVRLFRSEWTTRNWAQVSSDASGECFWTLDVCAAHVCTRNHLWRGKQTEARPSLYWNKIITSPFLVCSPSIYCFFPGWNETEFLNIHLLLIYFFAFTFILIFILSFAIPSHFLVSFFLSYFIIFLPLFLSVFLSKVCR